MLNHCKHLDTRNQIKVSRVSGSKCIRNLFTLIQIRHKSKTKTVPFGKQLDPSWDFHSKFACMNQNQFEKCMNSTSNIVKLNAQVTCCHMLSHDGVSNFALRRQSSTQRSYLICKCSRTTFQILPQVVRIAQNTVLILGNLEQIADKNIEYGFVGFLVQHWFN